MVMTDTSRYMAILAKVMQNKNLSDSDINKEKYNRLYFMIHSKLNSQLRKSMYPYTSDILQKTEKMMDEMEFLYLCPEMTGKKCMLVSSYITTSIFNICKALFVTQEYVSSFKKIHTQIPIVIVDNDDDSVEILNYANVRIKLTITELKFLIIESGKRKIALNKIVQFIIVKTKLKEPNLCMIADNIYAHAENVFSRTISQKLAYVDSFGVRSINKRHLDGFSALLMSDELIMDTINNYTIKKYDRFSFDAVSGFIKDKVSAVLYGFVDEFISVETKIINYYETQLQQSKCIKQELVSDIVRLEDGTDKTLQSMRTIVEQREKRLKSEFNHIKIILKDIEELVADISSDLEENLMSGKKIQRCTWDDLFESLFRCQNFSSGSGKKIISRLYSYGYDNYELLETYIQMVAGNKVKCDIYDIKKTEWEKAKMLISILKPDQLPKSVLKLYVEALGERCSTGEELYAKYLIAPDAQKRELLQDSFDKGYEPAGKKLIEMYKKGYHTINIKTLANSLMPEACMILAEQKMGRCTKRDRYADLTDDEFTYYKIAASKKYLPAIGKTVDIVFESRFSTGFQIPEDSVDDYRYEGMKNNGHEICRLCQFLIDKMYKVAHYNEILGIVMFSLNENLSYAMNLLSNANSALAYYCKGNMYEFGGGVSVDLQEAIKNYKKAINKGMCGRVEKRLKSCERKMRRNMLEESREDYYQPDKDYRPNYECTGSRTYNDGCFSPDTKILMADGTYCAVKNIKIGDCVTVFDHYKGAISVEKIVANVHDSSCAKLFNVIFMSFENGTSLEIVKSHVLFDITDYQYVWLDKDNVKNYIGHRFAFFENGKIVGNELIDFSIELKETEYYVPVSKLHLNVFAENVLTMPPTKLTVNMLAIKENMTYDLSILDRNGITSYDEISSIVTAEEYDDLPCKYLKSVLLSNDCSINDFEYIISLYRDQCKYIEMRD